MKRADRQDLVLQGERVFQKAERKYLELIEEVDKEGKNRSGDLDRAIMDAIRNLNRKIAAHLDGHLDMKRLISEFEFEKEALQTELQFSAHSDSRIKRFAKKILASIDDFIEKSGLSKRKSLYDNKTRRSTTVAYMLWLIGAFGTLGLHRFYLGKTGTGIAWVLTGGLFFMGALYDLFALNGMVENHNYAISLEERKQQKQLERRSGLAVDSHQLRE